MGHLTFVRVTGRANGRQKNNTPRGREPTLHQAKRSTYGSSTFPTNKGGEKNNPHITHSRVHVSRYTKCLLFSKWKPRSHQSLGRTDCFPHIWLTNLRRLSTVLERKVQHLRKDRTTQQTPDRYGTPQEQKKWGRQERNHFDIPVPYVHETFQAPRDSRFST